MRIHLRLAKGDLDLQYLFAHNNVNELVPELVRRYLQGKRVQIPMPPLARPRKLVKGVYIVLDDRLDKDVILWYRGLAKGYASAALKLLIRWSMEEPELRVFEQGQPSLSQAAGDEKRGGTSFKQAEPQTERKPPAPRPERAVAPPQAPAAPPEPPADPDGEEEELSPMDFI